MRYLSGNEKEDALGYIEIASKVALNSNCKRARCGSIIVKNNEIIGQGFNSPPLNICLKECLKDSLPKNFKSDKTCCMHAEQRAIFEALKQKPKELENSTIYFIRLDEKGNKEFAGKPFCTICSKATLDSGISEFVLYHESGICIYNTKEYNELSFQYKE